MTCIRLLCLPKISRKMRKNDKINVCKGHPVLVFDSSLEVAPLARLNSKGCAIQTTHHIDLQKN